MEDEILLEPYQYITRVPGKEIRTMLIDAFNVWMQVPEDKVLIIKEVTKMLHNASLLIDDIQDNSKLRRGIPVAHNVFGVAQTINSANYVYFLSMQKITALGEPRAVQAFTEQLIELHRGQGMDIYWRDAVKCPSEQAYREMVLRKTGGLFRLAIRLMQVYSTCSADVYALLDTLGLFFQIRDDYANLVSDEYTANKSFAEDLTEGKFSFPIIHAINSNPHDHVVINILRQHTSEVDLKRHCIQCIRQAGSFEYTKQVLVGLEEEAYRHIEALGGNPALVAIFKELRKLYSS
eukprot:m.56289 g.56289  ORF g.56289 m.56289 type:complete len:292 (-) comp12027_c0_seq1:220-1095(-)